MEPIKLRPVQYLRKTPSLTRIGTVDSHRLYNCRSHLTREERILHETSARNRGLDLRDAVASQDVVSDTGGFVWLSASFLGCHPL